eukprot:GDKI01007273.1.p1 GENE.GDKI01007273.1~~GDKI01007273.1.p1  ORF type:complete len:395 (+),score=68.65 GDKI01007273.1:265-1449(+)
MIQPWLYGLPLTRVKYPPNFRIQNTNTQTLDQVPSGKVSYDGRVVLIPSPTSRGLLVSEDYSQTFKFESVSNLGPITALSLSPDGSVRVAASGLKVTRWSTVGQSGNGKWSTPVALVPPSGTDCKAEHAGMSWPTDGSDVLQVFAVICGSPGNENWLMKLNADGTTGMLSPVAIPGRIASMQINDLGSILIVGFLDAQYKNERLQFFFSTNNFQSWGAMMTPTTRMNMQYAAMAYTYTQLEQFYPLPGFTFYGNYFTAGRLYCAVIYKYDTSVNPPTRTFAGIECYNTHNGFLSDLAAQNIPVYVTIDNSGTHIWYSFVDPNVFPSQLRNSVYYLNKNDNTSIYNWSQAVEVDWRLTYGYPQTLPASMYPPITSGDGKVQLVLDSDHLWVGRMA